MTLKSKIIIGSILGILWIAVCIALALMPKPKEVDFYYTATIGSKESYTFTMLNYNTRIDHSIKGTNPNEKIVETYYANMTEYINGGRLEYYNAESVEMAYGLEINVQNINFLGDKHTTVFKTVKDYAVLYINDKFVCFSETPFTDYCEYVGLYGSSLKAYKNPDIDIYFEQNETFLKELLVNEIYAINSNGDCSKKLFESTDDILEITYNNKPFTTEKVGKYKLTVKLKNDKTVNINALVYNKDNNPINSNIQIYSNKLNFKKTNHNKVSEFLADTYLKIKLYNELDFTPVKESMVEGLDTTIVGKQVFTINYKNKKWNLEAFIYENNETIDKLDTNNYLFIAKQGDDSFLDNLTLTATYYDSSLNETLTVKNNNSIEIHGYDKDHIIKQIVTLEYKNETTKILVVVLSEEDFEYYTLHNQLP